MIRLSRCVYALMAAPVLFASIALAGPVASGPSNGSGAPTMPEAAPVFDLSAGFDASSSARYNACTKMTDALLRACRYESDDDYHVAIARCSQISDPIERRECQDEAVAARAENRALCLEQFEERIELCGELGEAPYDPEIDPEDFLSPAEIAADPNPYFPLVPGTRWVYQGGDELNEVTVTSETKVILGVTCVVVQDIVWVNGELVEDTDDWYAQDEEGNIWYFGELVLNFENGELNNLDGSWEAGVELARAGMLMKASPEEGDLYRQELKVGDAEDVAEVISITATESAPAGSCNGDCVMTDEWTPIEPDAEASKFYAPGIGQILGVNNVTGEREELIEFYPGNAPAAPVVRESGLRVGAQSPIRSSDRGSKVWFELVKPGQVSADVFDASGRKIRSLVQAAFEAGSHTLNWDGLDSNARHVGAGFYFVRVSAEGGTLSRKVVVLH